MSVSLPAAADEGVVAAPALQHIGAGIPLQPVIARLLPERFSMLFSASAVASPPLAVPVARLTATPAVPVY